MYKFLFCFALINMNVFSQNTHKDTITQSDFCIDINRSNIMTIKKRIPVYRIQNSLYLLLEKKVRECFCEKRNVFSCYNFSFSDTSKRTCFVSIEVDFPIEEKDSLIGAFFVSGVPFFLNKKNIESSNFFVLIDSIVIVRNKIKSEDFSCIKTESSYYKEKLLINENTIFFYIENCLTTDFEKRKMPRRLKKEKNE